MKLIADGIRKSFDKKEVLKGASFTFEQGRIYVLLGIVVCIFTVLYVAAALVLTYRLAPKTFRLRK